MAARFCSKCGHEIASTAHFCPSCGTPLGSGGPSVTRVEAATDTTRRLLVPGMVAALVVLVIAVVLLAHAHAPVTSANSQPAPSAPSVLSAPAVPPPSAPAITNAPSQPAPSAPAVTNAASKPVPTLPPEDARYLAFLQGIEQRRVALNNDTSGATQMMQAAQGLQGMQGSGQDDPEQHNTAVQGSVGKISQGYSDYVTKCNDLARDFRTVNPPPDCTLIANNYMALLTDYAATVSKLQVALVNGDIGAAMGAQGAQKQVNTDASQADQQLAALCARFSVPKPFDIQVEGASSPLTGL